MPRTLTRLNNSSLTVRNRSSATSPISGAQLIVRQNRPFRWRTTLLLFRLRVGLLLEKIFVAQSIEIAVRDKPQIDAARPPLPCIKLVPNAQYEGCDDRLMHQSVERMILIKDRRQRLLLLFSSQFVRQRCGWQAKTGVANWHAHLQQIVENPVVLRCLTKRRHRK